VLGHLLDLAQAVEHRVLAVVVQVDEGHRAYFRFSIFDWDANRQSRVQT
jgi:hypothetical protein